MHQPTTIHWQATKRLLRYLKNTVNHGMLLHRTTKLQLHGYSDADGAGNKTDRTSTSAYLSFLGATPISWSTHKQRGVARSSTEAKYVALATVTSELVWILSLFSELGIPIPMAPTLFCDNIGATQLSLNPVFHSCMKHIAIDLHFVRDLVGKGILGVSHVSTEDQLTDLLNKSLSRQHFQRLSTKIGAADGTQILRGHIRDNDTSKRKS